VYGGLIDDEERKETEKEKETGLIKGGNSELSSFFVASGAISWY
jgi:hypothetical protein